MSTEQGFAAARVLCATHVNWRTSCPDNANVLTCRGACGAAAACVGFNQLSLSHAGHCSGTANITLPPSTLPSFVHLNLTCNVVSIQPGAVLEVFERAVMAFSRPTDPDHETGDQQVVLLVDREGAVLGRGGVAGTVARAGT